MNPAVGITKILNYLEESLEILEEIKFENKLIIEELQQSLKTVTDFRKELIKILENDNFEQSEKILKLAIESNDKLKPLQKILDLQVKSISGIRNSLLENLHHINENGAGRIKNLESVARFNWFKSWEGENRRYDIFKGIVTAYSNWEYPVLEIFPGTGTMLKNALSGEPLYIADWDDYVLDHCSKQFNEFYATKRLMKYIIEDYNLSNLPQKSFGFIYCINQSFIENLVTLKDLGKNVYNCLLPGGVFLLSYNSSNYWWSIENTLLHGYGNVDKYELEQEFKNLGFEIVEHQHVKECTLSYIIVKVPGKIDYIKNSSILANIIDKPEDLK